MHPVSSGSRPRQAVSTGCVQGSGGRGLTPPLPAAIALIAGLLAAVPDMAAPEAATPSERPRIGLVLGGGGAKGAAHIGVLRVLDEMRIPIDCVAGTSMGALVGATFAAGVPPAEIERQVLAINWPATVGSVGARNRMPIDRKLQGAIYTNSIELGVSRKGIQLPAGFLKTQEIEELLRTLVGRARYVDDFDQLPIPFRAVATDMLTAEIAVLGSGDLTEAMRASMAVPGAFAPVVIGDRVLSDGGQLRNVPIDIARELCGEVIIAVTLTTPPTTREQLRSALGLAGRSVDLMIEATTRAQLATLTAQDVSILVPMGTIGSASFERVPEAIPLGREAATAMAGELTRYSVSPGEYAAWRASLRRDFETPYRVAEVRVEGLDRVNPEYVRSRIRTTKPGASVTAADIAVDTTRIFALGDFEKVTYGVSGPDEAKVVEIRATEKSWGPGYLRFDLGVALTIGGDTEVAFRGEHNLTWINELGGEWRSAAQVGQDLELRTAFYQPLQPRQRTFVEPYADVSRNLENVYRDGDKLAEYRFTEGYGGLDFGLNLGTRAQLRAGVRHGRARTELDSGDPAALPDIPTNTESNLVVRATYDTRDALGLPTRGNLIIAQYTSAGSWLGGDETYGMAEAMALHVFPVRRDHLSLFGAAGFELSGELPPYRLFRLGGIRSFPGLERHQLRGSDYWVSGLNYNRRLRDIGGLFGQAIFGGLRLTAGRMAGRVDEVRDGVVYGIAGSLAGRTPVGPFQITVGVTDNDFVSVQMALGRPIREGMILDSIW